MNNDRVIVNVNVLLESSQFPVRGSVSKEKHKMKQNFYNANSANLFLFLFLPLSLLSQINSSLQPFSRLSLHPSLESLI